MFSASGGTHYAFKHALIQDAAYSTLPITRRRRIHGRIAVALEQHFPEIRDSQPERLAEHLERADAMEREAIDFWRQAAENAGRRSAVVEAERHLMRALELVGRLPEGALRDSTELDIEIQLGGILRALRGPGGLETGRAFSRARELCITIDPERSRPLEWLRALAGLFGYLFVHAENAPAFEWAEELRELADCTSDRLHRMTAWRALGMSMVHRGRIAEGRTHLLHALELHDPTLDPPLGRLFGTDPTQTTMSFIALSGWLTGRPDSVLLAEEEHAVAWSAKVDHLYSLIQTAMFRIIVRALARDWEAATRIARETLEVALRHSFRLAINLSRFYLSAERGLRTGDAGAVEEMRAFADAWGPLNYRPLY